MPGMGVDIEDIFYDKIGQNFFPSGSLCSVSGVKKKINLSVKSGDHKKYGENKAECRGWRMLGGGSGWRRPF